MNSPTRQDATFKLRELGAQAMAVILIAVLFIAAWEGLVAWWQPHPALLPSPRRCFHAGVENFTSLRNAVFATGMAATVGLAVATGIGSVLAIGFSQSRRLRLAVFPYVIFLQTVPIVAIAPLLIIWSGYTFRTIVIVTAIVCLFPIVNSVTGGLTRIDREISELFDLYQVNRGKRLIKLQIPSAIGDLITGVKTSSGLAVIGAIVAEFFVGNGSRYEGLGSLMTGWQAMIKTDALIASLFASAALGLALFVAIGHICPGVPASLDSLGLRECMHKCLPPDFQPETW